MASNRSLQEKKDRLKRSLPAFALVCLFIFGAGVLILIDSVSPGRVDTHAAHEIDTLCKGKSSCIVRLGQLVPGTWDTFFEFDPTVPQATLRHVTGDDHLHTAHSQRILLLQQADQVVHRQYAHTGQRQPMAGEVVFAPQPAHAGWVSFPANAQFVVQRCPTREGGSAFGLHGGTYDLLNPAGAAATAVCTGP